MQSWFIQLENKVNKTKMTIYENGLVYGKERNEKLFVLSPSSVEQIKTIIDENMYMFKKLTYYNERLNSIVLKVNDTSRKQRTIKIVGWSQTPRIMDILKNTNNHAKEFYK